MPLLDLNSDQKFRKLFCEVLQSFPVQTDLIFKLVYVQYVLKYENFWVTMSIKYEFF